MAEGAEYLAGKRAFIEKGCARVVELALDGLGSEALEALAMVRDKRAAMVPGEGKREDSKDAIADAVRRVLAEAEGTNPKNAKDSAAGAYASYVEELSSAWEDPPGA